MRKESIGKILLVTVLLCLVCSVIVSTAAVVLRPLQQENAQNDVYKNILSAVDLYDPERPVFEQFQNKVEMRALELDSGSFVNVQFEGQTSVETDTMELNATQDIAKIKKRPNYVHVYFARKQGQINKIVLPVYGYGLWSTMYGLLVLEADAKTVYGLKFYDHGETPGLGGEIDNPKWLKQWRGKKLYNVHGEPALEVIKGKVPADSHEHHKVDGLSGATLTSLGVSHLIHFWTGQLGYRKFLDKLQSKEIG